jgi:phage-related protein
VFQKKSKSGIATPKSEIELIHKQLASAEQDYKERKA